MGGGGASIGRGPGWAGERTESANRSRSISGRLSSQPLRTRSRGRALRRAAALTPTTAATTAPEASPLTGFTPLGAALGLWRSRLPILCARSLRTRSLLRARTRLLPSCILGRWILGGWILRRTLPLGSLLAAAASATSAPSLTACPLTGRLLLHLLLRLHDLVSASTRRRVGTGGPISPIPAPNTAAAQAL